MPPHCDTMGGPVVVAARKVIDAGNINLILPWAPKDAESEIRAAFANAISAGKSGGMAKEVADLWFFETVVRLHRAGEGAPYTGLKPAGLDEGPVIPLVDRAVVRENPEELVSFLQGALAEEVREKFSHVMHSKKYASDDVAAARMYVHHYLGLTLFSHHLHEFMKQGSEHDTGGKGHGH